MPSTTTRIVYMGTPDFAVEPLRAIVDGGYKVAAVVTVPDKPAGRGQKLTQSPVKLFAQQHGLTLLQPEGLKDVGFIDTLQSFNADIFVVVAFRMLPEVVWSIPKLGTFNLHASLLPHYRGAAPINWAVMNGEEKTGLTTFLIDNKIDTGSILLQEEIQVDPNETAGELHDKLMLAGGPLVVRTIEQLASGSTHSIEQDKLIEGNSELKPAPKLFKDTCKINWKQDKQQVHNQIRGLSPYPGAWTDFITPNGKQTTAKILSASIHEDTQCNLKAGETKIINREQLIVGCANGCIEVNTLQLAGKKAMSTQDVLRGMHGNGSIRML